MAGVTLGLGHLSRGKRLQLRPGVRVFSQRKKTGMDLTIEITGGVGELLGPRGEGEGEEGRRGEGEKARRREGKGKFRGCAPLPSALSAVGARCGADGAARPRDAPPGEGGGRRGGESVPGSCGSGKAGVSERNSSWQLCHAPLVAGPSMQQVPAALPVRAQ